MAADIARTRAHALPPRINRPFWSREAFARRASEQMSVRRGKRREKRGEKTNENLDVREGKERKEKRSRKKGKRTKDERKKTR